MVDDVLDIDAETVDDVATSIRATEDVFVKEPQDSVTIHLKYFTLAVDVEIDKFDEVPPETLLKFMLSVEVCH
jgi:hypothetical protein